MRYLTLAEVLHIHEGVLAQAGGLSGVRDLSALESALSQPKSSAGGADAYPSLVEKAAALCYSLCSNHPFIDGNKRVAHAAMEVFLILNGREIRATVEEQEQLMLGVASGAKSRGELTAWLQSHSHAINNRQ
jgi:death on curing protein